MCLIAAFEVGDDPNEREKRAALDDCDTYESSSRTAL